LIHSIEAYAFWRFIAGVGLAGELGAGITLVSEILHPKKRGLGTTLVASIGVSGAILAGAIAEKFDWRTCYFIGGGLGLTLLLLRIGVVESGMFHSMSAKTKIKRGHFLSLFSNRKSLSKYLRCILIGVPIWFVIGILVIFGPEFAKEFGVVGEVTGSHCIMWAYIGGAFGGLSCGFLSQLFNSRRRAMGIYIVALTALFVVYLMSRNTSSAEFYALCGLLGASTGYWSVFVTNAAEQFGTNMRATAAITVPNFVRGGVVPMTLGFKALQFQHGSVTALTIVGFFTIALAGLSLFMLRETYGKDLNAVELL
jgi:MFS family permease